MILHPRGYICIRVFGSTAKLAKRSCVKSGSVSVDWSKSQGAISHGDNLLGMLFQSPSFDSPCHDAWRQMMFCPGSLASWCQALKSWHTIRVSWCKVAQGNVALEAAP